MYNLGVSSALTNEKNSKQGWRSALLLSIALISVLLSYYIYSYQQQNLPEQNIQQISIFGPKIENSYEVINIDEQHDKIEILAVYKGKNNYYKKEQNTIVKNLKIIINLLSDTQFEIKIENNQEKHWEVPYNSKIYTGGNAYQSEGNNNKQYSINIQKKPLSLSVVRKSDKETIFSTQNYDFIFSKYYIQFSTKIPSKRLYGITDNSNSFNLNDNIYSLWLNSKNQSVNPVYLVQEENHKWHMVYLRNTNPMDISLKKQVLTYNILGNSIIHLRFFLGGIQPQETIKSYHEYLGGYQIPPLWVLGYHYTNNIQDNYIQNIKEINLQYKKNLIPIESFWSKQTQQFNNNNNSVLNVDPIRFSSEEFQNFLELNTLKYIPRTQSSILIADNFVYFQGISQQAFIKNAKGNFLIGKSQGKYVHYIDFMSPNGQQFWSNQINQLSQCYKFSGIQLNTQQILNECFGECPEISEEYSKTKTPIGTQEQYIPYLISKAQQQFPLNSVYYNNQEHINVHSLNILQSLYTTKQLFNHKKDLFILTQSLIPGQAKYTGHWIGEIESTWDNIRQSISKIFTLNLFGYAVTGVDICGENTPELCVRWIQVASFHPFLMNNQINQIQPWNQNSDILKAFQKSLKLRYSLIKYYYTLLVTSNGTGMYIRPLFINYPSDQELYKEEILNNQFMLGEDLLVTPALTQNVKSIKAYLPKDQWYELQSGNILTNSNQKGSYITINTPLDDTAPVFIRAGSIIQIQDSQGINRVHELNYDFNLIIAFTKYTENTQKANGVMLFLTEYNTNSLQQCTNNQENCLVDINTQNNIYQDNSKIIMEFKTKNNNNYKQLIRIRNLRFYGVKLYNKITQSTYKDVIVNIYVKGALIKSQKLQAKFEKVSKDNEFVVELTLQYLIIANNLEVQILY